MTRRTCWTCCLLQAMVCPSPKTLRTTNSYETAGSPWRLVSDKLRSYAAARREVGLSTTHRTGQCDNTAEVSRQHITERERQMRRFKSAAQAQRGLAVHAATHHTFRLVRHRLKAIHHRLLRERAFTTWKTATGVHQAMNHAPMCAPGRLRRKWLDNSASGDMAATQQPVCSTAGSV